MRVLHTNIGIYPERGGPPAVIVNLAAAQARAGHHVTIVSARTHSDLLNIQRRMLSRVDGGHLVSVAEVDPLSIWRCLFGSIENLPGGPADIIHIHEIWNPFDSYVARVARSSTTPYVVTVHGLLSPIRCRHRRLKKWLARTLFVNRLLERALFVQGLTASECDDIRGLVPTAVVRQVPNGYSAVSATNALFQPPHQCHLIQDQPFILFMSRLHPMKGIDLLVPAFERVATSNPALRLVIAGPDDGGLNSLNLAIASSTVRERIHVIGMVDGPTKAWLLSNATVFVLPSRDEGFSIAILEALSSGIPTVISPECHFPEAAAAGAAIEVALDPQAIADAVLLLLANQELHSRMSSAGLQLVRQHYTWDRIAALLLDLYVNSPRTRQ